MFYTGKKIFPHLFPFVSYSIKCSRKRSCNINIHIKNDIWKHSFNSIFIDWEYCFDAESLSLSLIGTGGKKWSVRYNNSPPFQSRFYDSMKCLCPCCGIEVGICEWMHSFIFPLFSLGKDTNFFGNRSRSRFTNMDYFFLWIRGFEKIHQLLWLSRLSWSHDSFKNYVHKYSLNSYWCLDGWVRIIPFKSEIIILKRE